MTKKKVFCFDFDGTLTSCDSLLAFISYARGRRKLIQALLFFSPLLVLMKLRLFPNGRMKEMLFSHFFKGVPLAEFDAVCREFARADSHIMRPDGMAAVRMAAAGGAQVLIVSASIDNWVAPFFESMGNASPLVVGTRVESKKGRLTGRFLTPNCYGAEKVRRIKSILKEPRDNYFITAFGDSRGDKEMFEYADKSYYRPFN